MGRKMRLGSAAILAKRFGNSIARKAGLSLILIRWSRSAAIGTLCMLILSVCRRRIHREVEIPARRGMQSVWPIACEQGSDVLS